MLICKDREDCLGSVYDTVKVYLGWPATLFLVLGGMFAQVGVSFWHMQRQRALKIASQSRPVRFATTAGDPPGSILESKNGANHGKYKPEVSLGNFLRVPGKCFCQDYFFNGFLWFFQHVKTEKVCKTIGGSFKFEGFVFLSKKCIDIDFRLRLSFMGLHFGVILTLRRLLGAMFGQEKRNY